MWSVLTLQLLAQGIDPKSHAMTTSTGFDLNTNKIIIFSRVQQEVGNQSELVNLAYQMLQEQIIYMINLDITVLQLSELILPKAEVNSTGIVQMKTPDNVNCLFTTLNEVCDLNISKENDVV